MVQVWKISADRVGARRALLSLLSQETGMPPEDLRFTTGKYGKPELDGIGFSMSHSGGLALIAFARGRQVGIDIEKHRGDVDMDLVGRRFLGLPGPVNVEEFYAAWTRREAAVKARGGSILLPAPLSGWQLVDIPVEHGYSAALCYNGCEEEVLLMNPGRKDSC